MATTEQVLTIEAWAERRRRGQGRPGDPGDPDDVDVEHPVPLGVVVRRDVADRADPGVVDQDVDPAELGDDRARSPPGRSRRRSRRRQDRSDSARPSRQPAPSGSGRGRRPGRPGASSSSTVAAPIPLAPPGHHGHQPVEVIHRHVPPLLRPVVQGRGSTWIFGPGPAPSGRQPASTSPTWSEPNRGRHQRARDRRPRRRTARWRRPARAEAPRMPTAVTSLRTSCAGVDQARRTGQPDEDEPASRARPARAPRAGMSRSVRGIDDRVPGQAGDLRRRGRDREAERAWRMRSSGPIARPGGPRRPGPGQAGRPAARSCPAPRMSSRSPAAGPAASTARRALPPGSTSAPAMSSTASGSASRPRAGTASCSARAPAKPPRMPISNRSAQTWCRPARQRGQVPQPIIVSAVTRRPSQAWIDARPDRRDTAAPLVAEPDRIGRLALGR